MRLLDRYVLHEILGYALLGLGVFLFILMTPEVLRLSELLARENISWQQVGKLFLSVLPGKLAWAVPLSVLTGLLMAISRLAADSEIIALQAAGVGLRRLLRPALFFALAGAALTLLITVWGAPLGARTIRDLQGELGAGQLTYEAKSRVFDERFPQRILYVQDTEQGGARWKGVLLADLSDSKDPQLTLAETAIVVPQPDRQRLRLHLFNGSTHTYSGQEPQLYTVSTFAESIVAMPLPAGNAPLEPRRNSELSLTQLWASSREGPRWRSARADFHRRLALPAACVFFGLIALPLGLLAERSGRTVGFVLAVAIALSYYFIFLLGDRLGRQGDLPPAPGVWLANAVLLVVGLFLVSPIPRRVRLPPWLAQPLGKLLFPRPAQDAGTKAPTPRPTPTPTTSGRPAGSRLPRTLDLYVVRGVLYYFLLQLLALVLIFALFSVLEMVDDIAARNIPWPVVARFVWYLLPQLLYWMCPLALLLGVLVELALLSQRNELVAIKGAGISLYRIAAPVLVVGLAVSALLFWLDNRYLPQANQRQEVLRNQIKGRPPQTSFQPERRWIFGEQPRIYHYAFFDPRPALLGRLTVLELDPQTFAIRRRIQARRAHWEPELQTWVLERGWQRTFDQHRERSYQPFQATSFPELTEPPTHFQREIRESEQMNWQELRNYIGELRQSGFDVTRLLVQWHKKFAYPLMATIIILLAFPFGLRMGRRGAVGGLALGVALGFSYWVLAFGIFEPLGNLALLPPLLAGWGGNLAFALAGVYLTLQVDT